MQSLQQPSLVSQVYHAMKAVTLVHFNCWLWFRSLRQYS